MIVSGGITIYAIRDAEITRVHLSTSTIVVDPYNVQAEPLIIQVQKVSGADTKVVSAYISVQAYSLNRPIEGAVVDFGYCSEASFTIPARDALYATATAVKVCAYSDAAKEKLVDSAVVGVICNKEPGLLYRGTEWTSGSVYRNGDFLEHKVGEISSIYVWSSRVEGNTSKAPWDITSTTDPDYGYWTHVTEQILFISKMIMANFAKLGSAIFSGNFTISEHGQSKGTNPETGKPYDYRDFGKKDENGNVLFTPNFMIDWLSGKVVGKDMDIKGGKVANFDIRNSILKGEGYGRNAVVIHDKINKTSSILGSPLQPSGAAGFKLGMYSAIDCDSVNIGLKVISKGSTQKQDLSDSCAGNMNLVIDGIGGANILPEVTDRWCVPGVLKVVELELSPKDDGTGTAEVAKLREWGHGIRFKHEGIYTSNCDNDSERMIYFDYYCKHEMVFMLPVNCSAVDYRNNGWFNFTPNVETRNALIDGNRNLRRMAVTWWDYQNKKRVPRISTYIFIGLPSPEPTYQDFFKKEQMDEILNKL